MTATAPPRRRRPRQDAPQPAQDFPPPTATSEQLVEDNLGLARQAAWKWHRRTQQPYDDLEAVAFVGLIRGCRRYDPERLNPANGRPYALSTYLVPVITGELLHWFRDRGHAVRFPAAWREQWGKVQRLLEERQSLESIAEQTGLALAELNEMLSAMGGTSNLDDLFGVDGVEPLEPELDRLAPLRQFVRSAWNNLHHADQGLTLTWWPSPRRQAFPSGSLLQFHRRMQHLLSGRRLREVLQLSLVEVDSVPVVKPPRQRRALRELQVAAVQLGLLVA